MKGTIITHVLDVMPVRKYLRGIESLAREGRQASDPRVILLCLAILRRQDRVIRELLEGA